MIISADSHIDLHWLPPTLFVDNAPSALRERMPRVMDVPEGRKWMTPKGVSFGMAASVGASGRPYKPGMSHRADRMAEAGIYDDGAKGILRLSDPDLRIEDQQRDGVDAEVLYGILGASIWIRDEEASSEVARIYNEWLAEFCGVHPHRLLGLASIPSHNPKAAIDEIRRVLKRGGLRGFDISGCESGLPLYHEDWSECWATIEESGLPVHFHTVGPNVRDTTGFSALNVNRAKAEALANGQYERASLALREMILGGVLEAYAKLHLVLSESGIGWVPYMLERMDQNWEDQTRRQLTLKRPPSEYWYKQCSATFQVERFGSRNLETIGIDNVMWASDFPHPDGLWPDSQQFIAEQFAHLSPEARAKVLGGNAAKLYGLEHVAESRGAGR
jgi:predicted TIM-barrel fold metal-dependent hydrolase